MKIIYQLQKLQRKDVGLNDKNIVENSSTRCRNPVSYDELKDIEW